MTNNKKHIWITVAFAAIALVATASAAYMFGAANTPQKQPPQQIAANGSVQQKCNDHNIVGMATGAVAGGVLGNQVGKGSGKTAATVGGAIGGGYLGQKMIPTNGVTCP